MSRFKQKGSKELPPISTSSLPDIIFMLLFFFMVTTTMKQADVFVKVSPPKATEVEKLVKKSLVSYIHVGPPLQKKYGTKSRIQLNDRFATIDEIQEFITKEREARNENEKKQLTTSLKVDKETKMGIVTDIKQELRQVGAFKVVYSSTEVKKMDL
jgi:biopolymer transport protein ExbD